MSAADQPALDPVVLRSAFGQFATGVCVLGLETQDGERIGMTLNSFTSVSLDPPLLLVCLGHFLRSHGHIVGAGGFGISVLAQSQQDVSVRFAKRDGPKWNGFEAERGRHGGLLVPGALAHFDCVTDRQELVGDHTLLIGRIVGCRTQPDIGPLLYFRGRYDALPTAA